MRCHLQRNAEPDCKKKRARLFGCGNGMCCLYCGPRFRNIPFVQFLFGADNLDCQEYDMRDLILYGRNAGNKYLSLAFECGIRLWITAHMPGLCLYDEISSKQKESNGFSVALFLYLYATKPATPLTKIYSVFAVFKPCRRWWRWSDSNWLPIRCERIALPGELHPRN